MPFSPRETPFSQQTSGSLCQLSRLQGSLYICLGRQVVPDLTALECIDKVVFWPEARHAFRPEKKFLAMTISEHRKPIVAWLQMRFGNALSVNIKHGDHEGMHDNTCTWRH